MALVSSRYAKALVDTAAEAKLKPAAVSETLDAFAGLLAESHELHEAIASPAIRQDEKLAVLDAVLEKLGSKDKTNTVRNFLAVLIGHGRIGLLTEVAAEYRRLEDESEGIAVAQISSAQPLTAAEKELLEEKIGKMAKVTLRAVYTTDESLIGGVRVRLGSTIYDGSVAGRLERLKQELLQG